MARWRVIAPHYIYAEQYGQPTEWAREETNRDTGRTFRKTMKVPMLVDPNDPTCCNRATGMCVVAISGSELPGDIVMLGPPTPDLEPLDDAAMALSDAERHKWISPIDSLPLNTGEELAAQLIRAFESQIGIAQTQIPASLKGADNKELAELKALIAAQQAQIDKLVSIDKAPQEPDVDLGGDETEPTPAPIAAPKPPPSANPSLRRSA